MMALARLVSRLWTAKPQTFEIILILSGAGLTISLLLMGYGLKLSPGF
jgi:hypothetical protein